MVVLDIWYIYIIIVSKSMDCVMERFEGIIWGVIDKRDLGIVVEFVVVIIVWE